MPSIALPAPLATLAAAQHGVLSRAQLHDHDLSDWQIRHRVGHGVLLPSIGDTFHVAGAPVSARAALCAATLAVMDGLAAVDSAAELHRIDGAPPPRPVVVTHRRSHHALPGVVVLRRDDLLDRHRCTVDGIPATTLPRTVLDLAAYRTRHEMTAIVDALTDARRLSIRVLFDEFDRIARRGRNGTAVMRRILEPRLAGLTVDRSELEARGLAFLRRHRFPPALAEFRPPWAGPAVARVDFAWPELRVVLELDGRRWHDRSDRFEQDRLRDQLAMAQGWIVVRVTWRQLHDDEAGVASRLRDTLRTRTVGMW